MALDIVDAQIHLFMTMDDEAALPAMDALGITSVLIDEAWHFEHSETLGPMMPAYLLPNGHYRPVSPGGIMASMRRPDRFSYFLRIDPEDPEMAYVMSDAHASPGCRAFRLNTRSPHELAAVANGERMAFFKNAERLVMPVFIIAMGRTQDYLTYIQACPSLPFIFDHCGIPQSPEDFDRLLELAAYPNVFVKWCHAPLMFGAHKFPFPEVGPFLARALDAFGRERLMWASDFTAIDYGAQVRGVKGLSYSWGEALFYMRANPDLSEGDLEWLLGRTARQVLNWPAAKNTAKNKMETVHEQG